MWARTSRPFPFPLTFVCSFCSTSAEKIAINTEPYKKWKSFCHHGRTAWFVTEIGTRINKLMKEENRIRFVTTKFHSEPINPSSATIHFLVSLIYRLLFSFKVISNFLRVIHPQVEQGPSLLQKEKKKIHHSPILIPSLP